MDDRPINGELYFQTYFTGTRKIVLEQFKNYFYHNKSTYITFEFNSTGLQQSVGAFYFYYNYNA